jgi:hypothetical protein
LVERGDQSSRPLPLFLSDFFSGGGGAELLFEGAPVPAGEGTTMSPCLVSWPGFFTSWPVTRSMMSSLLSFALSYPLTTASTSESF